MSHSNDDLYGRILSGIAPDSAGKGEPESRRRLPDGYTQEEAELEARFFNDPSFQHGGEPPENLFEIPTGKGAGLDSTLRKSPELLAAVVLGTSPVVLQKFAAEQKLEKSDPWSVRHALLEGDRDRVGAFIMALRKWGKDRLEEEMPAMARMTDVHLVREITRSAWESQKAGEINLASSMIPVAVAYASRKDKATRLLSSMRHEIRTQLQDAFPQRTTQMVRGLGEELRPQEMAERLSALAVENEQLAKKLGRASSRVEELEKVNAELVRRNREVETQINDEVSAAREDERRRAESEIERLRAALLDRDRATAKTERLHRNELMKLQQQIDSLTVERDELEQAMHPEEGSPDEIENLRLDGHRIMIVGGLDRPDEFTRALEERGAVLIHEDRGVAAAEAKVSSVTAVVIHTTLMSHSISRPLKAACQTAGVKYLRWNSSSVDSLLHVLKNLDGPLHEGPKEGGGGRGSR